MAQTAVNIDQSVVLNVIRELHLALQKYGLKDNRIALFGSFAKGNFHENSDIDMIVISSDFEGKNLLERIDMTAKAKIDVKRKFVIPMDILLKTPKEYDNSKQIYNYSQIL
ncbi:MAG: nucleotidyltransferase domain-containing protein [Paludibacter sp.]|nr:nucleotidyltransferase domain-containing protein [Paludibacter sp.]